MRPEDVIAYVAGQQRMRAEGRSPAKVCPAKRARDPAVVVTRDFHVYGSDDVRMDYVDGQCVGVTSIPLGHSAGAWVEKGLARWPLSESWRRFCFALRHAIGRRFGR